MGTDADRLVDLTMGREGSSSLIASTFLSDVSPFTQYWRSLEVRFKMGGDGVK